MSAAPEAQELIDRQTPVQGSGEMTIEVKTTGVQPKRLEDPRGAAQLILAATSADSPRGMVTAVGEGVEDFAAGDGALGLPAIGHGGIAQHTAPSVDRTKY